MLAIINTSLWHGEIFLRTRRGEKRILRYTFVSLVWKKKKNSSTSVLLLFTCFCESGRGWMLEVVMKSDTMFTRLLRMCLLPVLPNSLQLNVILVYFYSS